MEEDENEKTQQVPEAPFEEKERVGPINPITGDFYASEDRREKAEADAKAAEAKKSKK